MKTIIKHVTAKTICRVILYSVMFWITAGYAMSSVVTLFPTANGTVIC